MQFKSLIVLVSTAAFAFAASSVQDLLSNISEIGTSVTTLSNSVSAFPQTGGTMMDAVDAHNHVDTVVGAVNKAVETAKGISGPVDVDNSHAILDQFHHLVALIQSGTTAVVDKKDAFSAVGVGRAEAMIQLDLILLRNVVAALDAALVAIAPPECVDEGKDLSLAVQNALDEAIKAYST